MFGSRISARLLPAALTAMMAVVCCAFAAPARASVITTDFDGDGVVDHVVVSNTPESRLAAMSGRERLRTWLRESEERLARLNSRVARRLRSRAEWSRARLRRARHGRPSRASGPRRRDHRRAAGQHALFIGADTHASDDTETQATPTGSAGLSDRPIVHAAPTSTAFSPFTSDLIPSTDRSGRQAPRAPPVPAL